MNKSLGKMEKVEDLRTIWKHEAQDFSKWLSKEENLEMLSNTVGINIVLDERESNVGNFYIDLYATEEGTGRKIIIENQLESTNHEHLGKIITYASGKGADIVIWIVKYARDEHKQAIEWLNQHTDENINFFLIEVELWKIDNSLPAIKFNVAESPNSFVESIEVEKSLSNIKKLQLKFWKNFKGYILSKPTFRRVFSPRRPQPQHWYDFSTGIAQLHISLTVNTKKNSLQACIYIHDNKEMFKKFKLYKNEIENKIGEKTEWKVANKDCRIIVSHNGNIQKENYWTEYFEWLHDKSLKLKEIIKKYV